MIAHVDMDAFYASVEVLDFPELAGKPVVVGMGKRGVVSAASYEARKYGIRSAMPIFQAQRLCPFAVFRPVRMPRYLDVSRVVMETLRHFTPLVEPISVDEAFMDITGTERLWGSPTETGQAIKKEMKANTGLNCSVGIAPLRFLAKIASDRDKPDGLCLVEDLEEFLQTVSLAEVSGVGKRALAKLQQLGMSRLVDLRGLGEERLARMMGRFGARLWELAHGVDPHGVSMGRPVKSISNERTFSEDVSDREALARRLLELSRMVGSRLRKKGLSGRTVTLKLKHKDHRLATRSRSLSGPTDETDVIYNAAIALMREYKHPGPFRLIGVGVSGLSDQDSGQGLLFGRQQESRRRAKDRAEDLVSTRFGDRALTRASLLTPTDPTDKGRGNGREG